jgi:gliding motility-associated-like protein
LNTAIATSYVKDGENGGLMRIEDVSTNGNNVDPDADGSPYNNSVPTPITLNLLPARSGIGLAKSVSDTVRQANGSYHVTYKMVLRNYGSTALSKVQVADSLNLVFDGTVFNVIGSPKVSTAGSLKANANFGKADDWNLLTETSTLAGGKADTLWFTVNVRPVKYARTFDNIAHASAQTVDNQRLTDISVSGTNPDPDGNNDPAEQGYTSLVLPTAPSELFIPEGFSPNGDGINDTFVIQNVPAGEKVQLQVFNRWGTLVYAKDEYQNDWTGEPNQGISLGKGGLPDGTYYYVVNLSDGRKFVRYMTIAR